MSISPMCRCWDTDSSSEEAIVNCRCGSEASGIEWKWEEPEPPTVLKFSEDGRDVTFHQRYSSGTAVVRGDSPMLPGHHYYWEIRILSKLYGTDIMIGVGTKNVVLNASVFNFSSFLGLDSESWGFSYTGKIQHAGRFCDYGQPFSRGVVVGVYLDMWHGTLEFYLNRKPLGIAFRELRSHSELYPMVCSTAADSAVRLIYSSSRPASLMLRCCKTLAQQPSSSRDLRSVPGLQYMLQNDFWLLLPSHTLLMDCDLEDDFMSCFFTRRSMFPLKDKPLTLLKYNCNGKKFAIEYSIETSGDGDSDDESFFSTSRRGNDAMRSLAYSNQNAGDSAVGPPPLPPRGVPALNIVRTTMRYINSPPSAPMSSLGDLSS